MTMAAMEQIDILLAEDSAGGSGMALRALKKLPQAGCLTWMRDGAQGPDFLFGGAPCAGRTGDPKPVLPELKMPRVDGIKVLRQVHQREAKWMIPLVVLTGSAGERDVTESYRVGMNSYIVKPVDFTQFAQVMVQAGLYRSTVNRAPGAD